jgi:glycosyltransferase involved in cell wall biosynthesis
LEACGDTHLNLPRRLSVCYVVPGHDLLSSIGPTRNVLNLAQALGQWADVTVAFHRVADRVPPAGLRVLEIEPAMATTTVDDAAMRGVGYGQFLTYMRQLRRFVRDDLRPFDIVLEKSWLLSGYISELCRRRGQLGVPIENIVPDPKHAAQQSFTKLMRVRFGRWMAGRNLRHAPLIIAETEFLKKEIEQYWRVQAERIAVVDLGVDRKLFYPIDVQSARQKLGISSERTILMYVGVLDRTHNLEPAISALCASTAPNLELHVVGDGFRGEEYRQLAAGAGAKVIFHGRVPHSDVPNYIAAADLCLAPYDASAFSSGELGYSTMKIPEYLSVGRAVASVPSGRTRMLLQEGETGFLFNNDVSRWTAFLDHLPTRERLQMMGAAAAQVRLPSWEDTARSYLSLCTQQLKLSGRLEV